MTTSDIKEKAEYIMRKLPAIGLDVFKPWITFYNSLYGPTVVLHYLTERHELSVCLNHLSGVYIDDSNDPINYDLISAEAKIYTSEESILIDQGHTPTYTNEDDEFNFWMTMYNWIQQNCEK